MATCVGAGAQTAAEGGAARAADATGLSGLASHPLMSSPTSLLAALSLDLYAQQSPLASPCSSRHGSRPATPAGTSSGSKSLNGAAVVKDAAQQLLLGGGLLSPKATCHAAGVYGNVLSGVDYQCGTLGWWLLMAWLGQMVCGMRMLQRPDTASSPPTRRRHCSAKWTSRCIASGQPQVPQEGISPAATCSAAVVHSQQCVGQAIWYGDIARLLLICLGDVPAGGMGGRGQLLRGPLGQQGLPACVDAGGKAATAGKGAVAAVKAGAYTTPFAVGPGSSKEPSIEEASIKAAVLFRPGSPITIGRCGSLQSPTHGSSRVAAAADHAGTPGEQHGVSYPPKVGLKVGLSRIEVVVNHDSQQDCNNGYY